MILIVDDKPENIFSLKTILELHSFPTDTALSGEEALKKILRQSYALIILDVQMPGMDGFEATKIIREEEKAKGLPRLTIIAMTAHALLGDKERCLVAGMDDYISKPFQPKELKEKLGVA